MKIILLISYTIFIAIIGFACGPQESSNIKHEEEKNGYKKYSHKIIQRDVQKEGLKEVLKYNLERFLVEDKALSLDNLLEKTNGEIQELLDKEGDKVLLKIL